MFGIKKAAAFALAALTLCACAGQTENAEIDAASMSIEEKVGQLFLVRCDNENIDAILEKNPAGLVLFGTDFENLTYDEVTSKIESYREKSKYPLIIAADEEGGTVVRVSSNPNLADDRFKAPREYFAEGGMETVIEKEREKAALLKSLDIDINLAPVADVSTNPNDFIYERALGEDTETTAEFVSRTVEAAHGEGIAVCLKHFPGYGNNVDTHMGIALDERTLSEFEASDFLPFEAGIAAGADAIMVAHNTMAAVDDTQPASISAAVHDILRDELGFTGMIITDDMSMGAMTDYGTSYIKAVLAGNSLIITSDFETAYNEVLSAVQSGELTEEDLDKALEPTLKFKSENLSN
ncbi:MAG: beta-hexosaminidase [Firmicutes bacterium]|nr:beta-hexosaminidase [Bacillota bacterium]